MRTACNWPGCPESVAIGIRYCEAHQAQVWREGKAAERSTPEGKAANRFYASDRWRRLRAKVLAAEPFCRHCRTEGVATEASEVDHVDGNRHNNRRDNLQGLCQRHHSAKTRREMNTQKKGNGGQ